MFRQLLVWIVSTLMGVGLLAGCAGGSGVSVPQFPGREEVAQMKPVDAPDEYFTGERVSVDTWEMKGPLPSQLGHVPSSRDSLLGKKLHESVGKVDPVDTIVSKQMNCAARQFGHFFLEHDASPDPILESYLLSRCGVPDTVVSNYRWSWDDVDDVSDEELVEAVWSDEEDQSAIRSKIEGDNKAIGAALVRRGDRAKLLITYHERTVDLEPRSLFQSEGGTIELRGRILSDGNDPFAMTTMGPFDAANCELDDAVEPPQFHARCPRKPADTSTQISVGQSREDSIFGRTVLHARIWRDSDGADAYETPRIGAVLYSEHKKMTDTQGALDPSAYGSPEARERIVTLTNKVRAKAGSRPIQLHGPQSREVDRLAGRTFTTMGDADTPADARQRRKQHERVIRGLMAGWEIDAPVSDSSFAIRSSNKASLTSGLVQVLNSPSGRRTLLSEDFDLLAASLAPDQSGEGVGFIAFTYKGIPEKKFSERRSQVVDQINAERRARGIPEFDVDGATFVDCRWIAQRLEAGSLTIRKAQKSLMEDAVAKWSTGVRSNLTVTQSLDDISVPSRLLDVGISEAALVVAPFQPEGAAWTSYAIMWVHPSG